MVAKILMKNPVLMIGIILMGLFLNDLRLKGYFNRDGLIPTSCKASLIMLKKRIPSNWNTSCNSNEMIVKIDLKSKQLHNLAKLKSLIYRELANHLIFIAKNTPEDSLSRVDKIFLYEDTSKIQVLAMTEGKYLVKFKTLKTKTHIMKHLQNTVKVKEIIK